MNLTKKSHLLGFITALIIVAGVSTAFYMNKQNPQNGTVAEPAKVVAEPMKAITDTTAPVTSASTATKETATTLSLKTGAIIKTNLGTIEVTFFGTEAPKTVENFQKLAEAGFYDSTKFHRVIKNFMIQGGDPFSKDDSQMGRWGTGGPGYQFADEINSEKLVRGVLAMANAGPNTNGSQFFIVTTGATPWLDGKHTVFGKVVRGMDVVDKISLTPVGPNDIPKSPVIVESVTLK